MTAKKTTKIVRLVASNVKRLKAVEITPEGGVVTIAGKNGQGKTSVLDSIWIALGGAKAMPRKPVRTGAEEASIRVELDNGIIIERTIKEDGRSRLVVSSADGARYPSPQAMLDALVGALSFDPLHFVRMSAKERLELLKRLVGLDLSELERQRGQLYDERTTVGREVRRLEGEISGVPPHPDAPAEEVSVAAIAEEQRAADAAHREVAEAERALRKREADLATAEESAVAIRAQIESLRAELAKAEARLERGEKEAIPRRRAEVEEARAELERRTAAAPDREAIRVRLSTVEATNASVRANRRRAELGAKHDVAAARVRELTTAIEAVDSEKVRQIGAAPWPLPSLGLDEDGVTLAGVPFEQASSAEQLRASVAMGAALNPRLRVLLVRDGSLLDADSLRMLSELAAEQDLQVWLERVEESGRVGVVIEDGSVKGAAAAEEHAP